MHGRDIASPSKEDGHITPLLTSEEQTKKVYFFMINASDKVYTFKNCQSDANWFNYKSVITDMAVIDTFIK